MNSTSNIRAAREALRRMRSAKMVAARKALKRLSGEEQLVLFKAGEVAGCLEQKVETKTNGPNARRAEKAQFWNSAVQR